MQPAASASYEPSVLRLPTARRALSVLEQLVRCVRVIDSESEAQAFI